jgi:Kdo2-lipid IVA lauroyltransferase/acyltransferase
MFAPLLYYIFLIPLSLLPPAGMYAFSDFMYLVLYRLLGYRKKVVVDNLRKSFPEKSDEEIRAITKKFYRHFCDIFIEGIKPFTASEEFIQGRVKLVNGELLEKYFHQNRSVILATGHYANWEWPALAFIRHSSHKALGIYKPLTSKFFDRKLQQTRSKFGLTLMAIREVAQYFEEHKNEPCSYGFIFDQSPSNPSKGHWVKFLNRDTVVLTGVERYARQYDFPVIYGKITREKRGFYRIEYELITDTPQQTREGEITEAIMRVNEKLIVAAPEFYLWTHRRWKHKRT